MRVFKAPQAVRTLRRRARELERESKPYTGMQRLCLAVLWLAVVDSLQYTKLPRTHCLPNRWQNRRRSANFYQVRHYHRLKARERQAAYHWIMGSSGNGGLWAERYFERAFWDTCEWKTWLHSFSKMHSSIRDRRNMTTDVEAAQDILKMLGPHPSGPPVKSRRGYVQWQTRPGKPSSAG